MKKLLFFFALLFMGAMTAFAQVPVNEQLTYQTVVRNAQNQLVFNQNDVTVKVYVCNVDGTVVTYSETHTGLSTNANGMLSLMIGSVAPDQGTWDGIDWSTAYIKTTISYGSVTITHDPAPVTAVPYALSAGNMSNITNLIGDAIHDSINRRLNSVYDSLARLANELEELRNSILPAANAPTVSNATSTSMNVKANATSQGADITSYEFCYSINSDMSGATCQTVLASDADNVTFTGLTPNTDYYVQYKATNVVGTTASPIVMAHTPAHAPTANVSGPAAKPAGFKVDVTDIDPKEKTDETTVQVCYYEKGSGECPDKESSSYTCADPQAVATPTETENIQTITGLEPSTAYCAIVKVSNGDSTTIYGPYTVTTGTVATLSVTSDAGGTVNLCGETTAAVTFTATITGDNASDFTYAWSNGTSTTSKDTVALAEGPHTITVTATHNTIEGYTLTGTASVTIANDGTAVSLGLCEWDGVVTVKTVDGSPNSIDWGDGSTPYSGTVTANNTSNTYTTSGSYDIVATNSSGCRAKVTMQVNVPGATAASRTVKPCDVGTHLAQTGDEYKNNGHNHANYGLETVNGSGQITSVTDYDGNEYPVVQIGSQCWLAENLRCTHSPKTGSNIVGADVYLNKGSKLALWYNHDESTYAAKRYGILYNWCAAMDTAKPSVESYTYVEVATDDNDYNYFDFSPSGNHQGVCPKGWHVPTDAEWSTMVDEVGSSDPGKLTTGCDWNSSSVSQDETTTKPGNYCYTKRNDSGFSAVPAGSFYSDTGSGFGFAEKNAHFWSSTQHSSNVSNVCVRYLIYNNASVVSNSGASKRVGFSVRCVRDSVTVLGNDTPKPCTAASRGSRDPQVAGTYTPAHGSDGLETVDANENITSVKDIDNNEYKVVEIGSQCWMAVNLRTTHYADNTPITLGTTSNKSAEVGYYYDYSSDDPSIPLEQRGYLYNWPAAMKSTSNPEGTQGICPTGWHLPTKAEWQTMVANADASTLTGAVYLSASCYWNGSNPATDGMTPNSYDNPDRNKSGFSAVPAGFFDSSSFVYSGNNANFWSSSSDGSYAWCRYLDSGNTYVRENKLSKKCGYSVRCVRD